MKISSTPAHLLKLRRAAALLLLLVGLAVVPLRAASEQEDERLIAELTSKRSDLLKQLVATTDAPGQTRLLQALSAAADETWPKLTPKGRTFVKFSLEVIEPWEQANLEYKKLATDPEIAAMANLGTLKSRADLQARLVAFVRVDQVTQQLYAQTNNLEPMVAQLVDGSELSEAEKQSLLKGFHEKYDARTVQTKEIRSLNVQMSSKMLRFFAYLEEHWGKWELADARTITWKDATLEAPWQALGAEVGALIQKYNAAQQALKPSP